MDAERVILEWAVRYVHDLCTDDNGTLEVVLEQTKLSEVELFDGFENLSIDHGFDLGTPPVQVQAAKKMPLLEYLMVNYEVDNMTPEGVDNLWVRIKGYYGTDDFVELANILVLLDNLPKDLTQKFWDNM